MKKKHLFATHIFDWTFDMCKKQKWNETNKNYQNIVKKKNEEKLSLAKKKLINSRKQNEEKRNAAKNLGRTLIFPDRKLSWVSVKQKKENILKKKIFFFSDTSKL